MKKNRLLKVLTSAALTAVMVASMGTSAFAAVTEIGLKKTVTTDGNTYAPNTTFGFTLGEGDAGSVSGGDFGGDNLVVYRGVEGGISLDDPNVFKFGPEEEDMKTVESSYERTGKININTKTSNGMELYDKPGIYHYTIKENQGSYEGIIYDTAEYAPTNTDKIRDIYVYVEYKAGSTTEFEVTYVVVAKDGKKQGVNGNIEFVNNYGEGNNNTTHDLTVTKKVEGNQANKNQGFDFTVNVTGTPGEYYKIVKTDKDGNPVDIKVDDKVVTYLVSGTSSRVSLKNDESIQIFGLTANDKYTVSEADYTSDGYTTTLKIDEGAVQSVREINEQTLSKDGTKIEVTNTKDVSTPTGIVLSFAPYILLVALAGVFGVSFLRKKREDF